MDYDSGVVLAAEAEFVAGGETGRVGSMEKQKCTVANPSDDAIALEKQAHCVDRSQSPAPPVEIQSDGATDAQDAIERSESLAVAGPSFLRTSIKGPQCTEAVELLEVGATVDCEAGDEPPSKRLQTVEEGCQTDSKLLEMTEAQALEAELKAVQAQIKSQEMTLKRLKARNTQLKLERQSRPLSMDELLADLTAEQKENILRQVNVAKYTDKELRYTIAAKQRALGLFYSSPKCYRVFRTQFLLPSPPTLQRFVENIRLKPGVNESLMKMLEIKVGSMEPMDKYCSLCFDEIAVKSHLFYNTVDDAVIGFPTLDDNARTVNDVARYSLVVMVRGLKSDWKQPIAYVLSREAASTLVLKKLVLELVSRLSQIGLKVKALICDMGRCNVRLAEELGITEHSSVVKCNGEELVFIFDPPHLWKSLRNQFLAKRFQIVLQGCVVATIAFVYVQTLFDFDQKVPFKLAPRLTDEHMKPQSCKKMKVNLATDLFSVKVANGLGLLMLADKLPAEASHTREFIEMFDKLLDMFNATAEESPKPFKGTQKQRDFLIKVNNYLSNLRVLDEKGNDSTNRVTVLKCLRYSINGLLDLWSLLKKVGFKRIQPEMLNLDSLEDFFGQIRKQGDNDVKPTPVQFSRSFKKLVCMALMHTGTENSADVGGKIHLQFSQFYRDFAVLQTPRTVRPASSKTKSAFHSIGIPLDYRTHSISERNAIRYTCGYLMRKCLQMHSCQTCEEYGNAHQMLDENTTLSFPKACETDNGSTFDNLNMPPDEFSIFICNLETKFRENFENFVTGPKVSEQLVQVFRQIEFQRPCEAFPYEFLLKLFARMRIFYELKGANKKRKTQRR